MSEYAEVRAMLFHRATGVSSFPNDLDIWKVVELLEGTVRVRRSRHAREAEVHWEPEGEAVITLPVTADERAECRMVRHEVGHVVLGLGAQPACLNDFLERQVVRATEAEVRYWEDAWALPAHLVRECPDDEDLAWQSGCDLEQIRRRRQQLQQWSHVSIPREGPAWCARRVYTVLRFDSPNCRRFCVEPRSPDFPAFEFSFTPGNRVSKLWELHTHLLALRPEEFIRRYSVDEVKTGVIDDVPVWELLEGWAEVR